MSWTAIIKNTAVEDDPVLSVIPYFGDDDREGVDLSLYKVDATREEVGLGGRQGEGREWEGDRVATRGKVVQTVTGKQRQSKRREAAGGGGRGAERRLSTTNGYSLDMKPRCLQEHDRDTTMT